MSVSAHSGAETAARHLTRRVPVASADERVRSVLVRLPGNVFDSIEAVYIIDKQGYLQGSVRILDLLVESADCPIGDVMTPQPPTVYPDADQEDVAGLAIQYDLLAVPVVDSQGYFLGVVPGQALMDILRHEHIEDLNRLAGIQRGNSFAQQAMGASPMRRARDRLPWLLVGLGGSILATFVVSRFEQMLAEQVFVSFFVPGIVYLADAIGTQTEAIAVRGLSLNKTPLQISLMGELQTGFLIGLALGTLSFPMVFVAFSNAYLALAVALAVFVAGGVATTVGLLFPWILDRAGKDPAFGSGPVATIIQDVLSLVIYFVIVQLLVV
jgi:magnesium transporter